MPTLNIGVRPQAGDASQDNQSQFVGQRWTDDPGRLMGAGPGTVGSFGASQGYGFQPAPYDPAQTRHQWRPVPTGPRTPPGNPRANPNNYDASRAPLFYPAQRTAEMRDIMSNRAAIIQESAPDTADRRYMPNGAIQQADLPFTYWALETPRYNLNQIDEAALLQAARVQVMSQLPRGR